MIAFRTIPGAGQPLTEVASDMAERITALVYEYADRVPLVLAVGVLEIVKAKIMEDHP